MVSETEIKSLRDELSKFKCKDCGDRLHDSYGHSNRKYLDDYTCCYTKVCRACNGKGTALDAWLNKGRLDTYDKNAD